MIIKNLETQEITIFLGSGRELILSNDEFAKLKYLIKNQPPVVDVKSVKLWSP